MKLPKKDELKELLVKGWIPHDVMWFYNNEDVWTFCRKHLGYTDDERDK